MEGEKIYTPQEVADMLRVSRTTVYTYLNEGKLDHYKVGSKIRISENQLKQFIGGNQNDKRND